jgi:3-mercaptopyruvate sulfurtransferase SseA
MIRLIGREQIQNMATRFLDATFGTPAPDRYTLVEIGPSEEYDESHLVGAIHLSETQLSSDETVRGILPSRGKQIVLYGAAHRHDIVWRAAQRLATLGYMNLLVYDAGKEEWLEAGLDHQTSLVPADRLDEQLLRKSA